MNLHIIIITSIVQYNTLIIVRTTTTTTIIIIIIFITLMVGTPTRAEKILPYNDDVRSWLPGKTDWGRLICYADFDRRELLFEATGYDDNNNNYKYNANNNERE